MVDVVDAVAVVAVVVVVERNREKEFQATWWQGPLRKRPVEKELKVSSLGLKEFFNRAATTAYVLRL